MTYKKCIRSMAAALLICMSLSISAPALTFDSARKSVGSLYGLSDYVNLEALVMYDDGSTEVFSYSDETALANGIDELSDSGGVALVQPNFVYTGSGTLASDALFSEQWALQNDGSFTMDGKNDDYPVYDNPLLPGRWPSLRGYGLSYEVQAGTVKSVSGIDINIESAWQLYNGGEREVIIALIDTGVDIGHSDFDDVFWVNRNEIPNNGIDDDGNGYVDDINGWNYYDKSGTLYVGSEDSHGTHGAGSIAAASDNGIGISGIVGADSVKIMVLKVLGGADGTGTTESVVKAIQYAEANGAHICNMSIGGNSYDRALYEAMAASEMLFVVSAGNDGADSDRVRTYPAGFTLDSIISVANLQPDGTLHPTSNYGNFSVDIAVPGTYIMSLVTNNTYGYMSGTSMSAPILTGVAAMLYAYCADLTALDAKDIILSTARRLDALNGLLLTGGMLDAGAAMEYLAENYESYLNIARMPFSDVFRADNSYDAILWLYENGIMNGTGDTTFSPESTLTRAMAITLLGRLAQAEPRDSNAFTDVESGTWYSGYIGWAVDNGIVEGYGGGLFGPNDMVTAGQLNLMLSRYAALLGYDYYSGLSGNAALTRAETAQALYSFCLGIGR